MLDKCIEYFCFPKMSKYLNCLERSLLNNYTDLFDQTRNVKATANYCKPHERFSKIEGR